MNSELIAFPLCLSCIMNDEAVLQMLRKRLPEACNNPGVIFGKSYYGHFYVVKKEK